MLRFKNCYKDNEHYESLVNFQNEKLHTTVIDSNLHLIGSTNMKLSNSRDLKSHSQTFDPAKIYEMNSNDRVNELWSILNYFTKSEITEAIDKLNQKFTMDMIQNPRNYIYLKWPNVVMDSDHASSQVLKEHALISKQRKTYWFFILCQFDHIL